MAKYRGIITYYDGTYGEIKTQEDTYIFLNKDLADTNIHKGSVVSFNGEEVQGIKRAYFVNNLEKDHEEQISQKEKMKELI